MAVDPRIEELRGLFTLGLLAVIASIRIQGSEMMVTIDGVSHNIAGFLDIILITWFLYAFFMVFGLSKDIIGEKVSTYFLRLSHLYLLFGFVTSGLSGAIFFNLLYPDRAIWIFAYPVITICYFMIKKVVFILKKAPKFHRPNKSDFSGFLKKLSPKLKKEFPTLLLSLFINMSLLIIFGVHIELVIPSFIVGSIFLVGFLISRDLTKQKGTS